MKSRNFHLGDILSITTGCLLSPRRIQGVYDILNFMTGDKLFTHQLPRASDECKPFLLQQHPQLANVDARLINRDNFQGWLAQQVQRYGEQLPVTPIPKEYHKVIDPMEELESMVGRDRIITVTTAPSEGEPQ